MAWNAASPCYTRITLPLLAPTVIAMLDPRILEEISQRLGSIIAASPAADIERNARALLASVFAKLDLVSREEFDIQAQVLQRTREKLKALEARIERLENPPAQPD
ncbi:MAG: Membrane fusogenic activity [Candidatus Accumulibacter adjunctus]|uniref:Ubiquinone biosynthesis accessory factor UbiK n=1 Tax=Candidatus Accumulibacter adjunctus TaxID=1454001 RepID=A0A011PQB8_9PROT|nr:MAG: Membrane fusogenic activity [Candidatus Accumulibacter adjunctus]